jgi:hypothetical protein
MPADDYLDIPFEENPDELANDAFELLQSQYPDWVPNDGNLDTWLIEAMARIAGEVMHLAGQVPKAIFKFAGEDLFRVLPELAQSATAGTTWTMVDNSGYTIPEGTLVGIRAAGDVLHAFQTVVEIVIPPGQTVNSNVSIIAVEEGTEASGIGTTSQVLEMIDQLDFINSVTLNAPTSGGEDEEPAGEYLNRLREQLRLLTPRPVLGLDYGPVARTQPGIGRSVGIDNWIPGLNEKQEVQISPDPTGGTFTLTWNSQTTAAIVWNATPAQVQTALENLSNIAVGEVRCTGTQLPAGAVFVEFMGSLGESNVSAMTGSGTNLTGPGGPFAVGISTLQGGTVPTTNADKAVTVAVTDADGEPVDPADKVALDIYLQALREQNFIISVIDANYTVVDVTVQVKKFPEYTLADVEFRVEEALTKFLSPKNWGKADLPISSARGEESTVWQNENVVRYLEIAAVINAVEGVDYITTSIGLFDLTTGVGGGTQARLDINLVGTVPLPRPGVLVCNVI